jgi:beta-mannosidase
MIPSGAAGQSTSRVLEAKWEFRADSNTDRADVKEWHPAQVPGVVQTDLLRDGLIPDPFYQDNDTRLQWIGLSDWEYRTTFQADPATISHEHVDLVFGID